MSLVTTAPTGDAAVRAEEVVRGWTAVGDGGRAAVRGVRRKRELIESTEGMGLVGECGRVREDKRRLQVV